MNIWITRHGQTDYNKAKVMQGRNDIPLNEAGISQAKSARCAIGDMKFDAVYSSPLIRAVKTACIIGNVTEEEVIRDERIIEAAFGKYEARPYGKMGPAMSMYWTFPEIFKAPESVESIESMVKRAHSFLRDVETKPYNDVLIVCHGGIIRSLCGYLEDRPNGIKWRPRPKNCEIRVYKSENGVHKFLKVYDALPEAEAEY